MVLEKMKKSMLMKKGFPSEDVVVDAVAAPCEDGDEKDVVFVADSLPPCAVRVDVVLPASSSP